MAKSAFLGPAYALRSLPLAAQTCINLYVEPNEAGNGEPGGFYGTPGLLKRAALPSSGHRASIVAGGYLWAVVGASVYKISTGYVATLIGALPNTFGPVRMAQNGTQVGIAHPDGWHVVTLSTDAIAAVPDAPTMSDISFIDNYGVGANVDGTYSWSALADFASVDALSFASAEGHPDRILRTIADHRELWLMGEVSIEVAVVNGDADLPFTRTAFMEQGILAPASACKEDNSVLWLGKNEKGQGVVYRANGYTPTRISTHAIEQAIQTYANPELATGYTYQQDGHHFYVLSFAEATWAYDLNTGLWAQRGYRNTTTGELERHRAETHCFFNGAHVVGDYADGRLYVLDLDTFTDDGDPIYRERTWAQLEAENKWIRHDRGELIAEMGVGNGGTPPSVTYITDEENNALTDEYGYPLVDETLGEPGADPQVNLCWSDDGGRTYGNNHARSLGQIGVYRNRAMWRRMGRSRSRYYRLWTSEPVRTAWMAFNLDMDVSTK